MQSIGACTSHTHIQNAHSNIIKMSCKWRRQSTTTQYYVVDGRKHKQFAFIIRLTILRIRTIGFRFVLLVFSLFVLKVRIYHLQWQVRLIWLLTTIVLVLWLFFRCCCLSLVIISVQTDSLFFSLLCESHSTWLLSLSTSMLWFSLLACFVASLSFGIAVRYAFILIRTRLFFTKVLSFIHQ